MVHVLVREHAIAAHCLQVSQSRLASGVLNVEELPQASESRTWLASSHIDPPTRLNASRPGHEEARSRSFSCAMCNVHRAFHPLANTYTMTTRGPQHYVKRWPRSHTVRVRVFFFLASFDFLESPPLAASTPGPAGQIGTHSNHWDIDERRVPSAIDSSRILYFAVVRLAVRRRRVREPVCLSRVSLHTYFHRLSFSEPRAPYTYMRIRICVKFGLPELPEFISSSAPRRTM